MKEQEHYAESVQYSIDRTKASLEELAHDFLSSDLLKGLIEGANTFLQKVDEIISKLGTLGTVITGVAAGSTIHGLFTNEGMVAGGIKALTNQKFGEANQRRSMWGNIRQLLGWDEPYYDIEESKSAMAQNATEEFKDAAAKENTAGASATKTAAIEAETAAMEANTQAIQRNTAAENGDNIADAVEDKIDDVPEIDLPDIDPDNLKKESKKKAETFVESYGDAITDYYDELDGKVKPTDLLDDDYYDELQEFMSENLDDIPSGVMKPAGEAIEAVVDVAEDAIPELADDIAAVGTAAGEGFVSKFVAALSGLGGKISTIFSAIGPAALIGGAVAGALIGKTIYDQVQEAQRKAATSATDKYNERKEQVTGYKDRYETLYKDLHDSSKSEAERVQIREQILGLQQEITGAYGAEAAAVDLVNGELREQLNIMDGLVDKQIEKNNKDPNVKKGYADAKEAMTKRDKYDFGEILDGSSVSRELRKAMEEIEGVDLVDGMEGTGTKIIRFEGDATGAKKAADEVQTILDDLQQKYIDDDNATAVLKHVNESMIPESDRLNDLLDRHHDNYIAGLEQELTTQQRKSVDELGQAIKDVNTAASSGEGFEEAYSNYVDKLNNIKLDSSHMPIVDELKDGLDEAAVSGQNFLDIINDDSHIGNNNQFAKDADLIQGYAVSLKELGLQGIDVKEVLNDPLKSTNEGKEQILGLAKAFGVLGDDMKVNEEFVDSFITALLNAGTIADSVADAIEEKADDSFASFRSSIINDIANIDTLNAAIAESFSGKGLSYSIDENGEVVGAVAEIKKAYGELMQEAEVDESALFQSTALGLKTNQSALRALQSELEAKNKSRLAEEFENANDQVDELQRKVSMFEEKGLTDTGTYKKLSGELASAKSNLESVRELQAAYEGATSAYQKWVNAQSMGEEGDVYNAIRETAFKRGDELLEQGLVGTNEFRAIAQMFSDEDLSTAGIEKIISEYQAGSAAVKSFFTEGYEGLAKFGEDAASKGIEGIKEVRDEAGNLGYAFENVDVQQIADAYGVSASVIESIFGRMADYGIEVQRYSGEASEDIQKLNQQATEAQKTLKDHVTEFKTATEETNAEMQKLQEGGNVDLFNRPQISTQKLVEAGWDQEDVGEGTATVFSNTYSNEDGTIAMNFTPILPDGSVMEPGEFANYCDQVVSGVREDDLQLKVGATFEGEDAIDQAVKAGDRISDLQAEYYGLDGTSIDLDFNVEDLDTVPELESKIKELEDYQATLEVDSSEYKAAGDLLDQLKQKKDAVEQATNIPVTYTDLENANTAMSQLQSRITEIQNYNATATVDVDVQNDAQVQQLANDIATLPKDAQISVGIKEENLGDAQAIVQQIQDNPASITVTPELVGVDEELNKEGKINYTASIGTDLPADILFRKGDLKYNASIGTDLPADKLNRTGTITYNTTIGKDLSKNKIKKTQNETKNVTTNETTNKTIKTTVTGDAESKINSLKSLASSAIGLVVNVRSNADEVIKRIKGISNTPADVKIGVEDSEVQTWDPPAKTGQAIYQVNASAVYGWSPPIMQGTVNYKVGSLTGTETIKDLTRKVNYVKGTGPANGTAHWQGTAGGYYSHKRIGSVGNSMINHYSGNSYARGSWGLKQDEPNALVNELGSEIIVRNGQWMIANNGFPTLADSPQGIPGGLQKGDIIFNHKQTEEILKHGYVTGSHARLAYSGSAHANGTVVGGTAHAYDKVNTFLPATAPAKQATTTASNVTVYSPSASVATPQANIQAENADSDNAGGKNKTKKKNILEAEQFDWIEIRLKRIDAALEKLENTANATFNAFIDRVTDTEKAIAKVGKNIKQYEKAEARYEKETDKITFSKAERKQAKKLGITTTTKKKKATSQIKNKADNGAIDISTIYIDEEKLNEKTKSGKKTKAAKKEEKKKSLLEKIKLYQQWSDKAHEAADTVDELKIKEVELYKQRFDLLKEQWENELDIISDRADSLNNWIEAQEAMGEVSGTAIYDKLLGVNGEKRSALKKELESLQDAFNKSIGKNGQKIEKGSADWYEMADAIREVKKQIEEADKETAELLKKIREFENWKFDTLQERISNASNEFQFLAELMSDEKLVTDDGFVTEYGVATIGAYVAQIEYAKQQVSDYATEIEGLEKYVNSLTNGGKRDERYGGLDEAITRLNELHSAQQNAIKTQDDMRKSIKSLIQDGWKKEADSLKEVIDEYTKMLDTQKSEYDYSKKITEQQEKITSLRRQLASWGNDSSEEGSAKRQKTAKELREAEEALAESQDERRISQIKEILSNLSDEYEKIINERLTSVEFDIDNVTASINTFQGNIGKTLQGVASDFGLTLSSNTSDAINNMAKKEEVALGKIDGNLTSEIAKSTEEITNGIPISNLLSGGKTLEGVLTDLNGKIIGGEGNTIASKIQGVIDQLKRTLNVQVTNADNNANAAFPSSSDGGGTSSGGGSSGGGSGTSGGGTSVAKTAAQKADESENAKNKMRSKAMNYIMEHASKPTKSKSKYSDVNKKIWELTKGKVLSTKELKALAKIVKVTYDNATSKGKFYAKLKSLRVLKRGTRRVPDNDYYWTQEGRGQNELITRKSDGAIMTRLGKGDMVFNSDMTRNLWALAKNPPPYADIEAIKAPDISSNISIGDSSVDITFNLPNVANADEFMKTLQKSKKFEQIVQSMTIGRIQGKGTLNKYNTRI